MGSDIHQTVLETSRCFGVHQKFCLEESALFFETSAKTGLNVTEAVRTGVEKSLELLQSSPQAHDAPNRCDIRFLSFEHAWIPAYAVLSAAEKSISVYKNASDASANRRVLEKIYVSEAFTIRKVDNSSVLAVDATRKSLTEAMEGKEQPKSQWAKPFTLSIQSTARPITIVSKKDWKPDSSRTECASCVA
eukprot:m.830711 g.830711  ORF g.830711 m.830711 type:complete len:191 (-) comp23425_c1_seq7:745-1317(-)